MPHIFHVHTARCKHGSDESDEAFVKTAVALGASKITFTDHSPFPGDSFKNRMGMSQLPEYIASLKSLKDKYRGTIEIEIGLEMRWINSIFCCLRFYGLYRTGNDARNHGKKGAKINRFC